MTRSLAVFAAAFVSGLICAAARATVGKPEGYPCWRGPYGTGAGVDCGTPLVDNADDAKILWVSEKDFPPVYVDPKWPDRFPITHYGSPVVADGRVYYFYIRPSGPVDAIALVKVVQRRPDRKSRVEKGARMYADDMCICLDGLRARRCGSSKARARGST